MVGIPHPHISHSKININAFSSPLIVFWVIVGFCISLSAPTNPYATMNGLESSKEYLHDPGKMGFPLHLPESIGFCFMF